ncbi:hypothetical protein TRICI_002200 [Trichomonascus ciferrii]|uniref:Uncharacterized protein n=1 Tax=Trichomonascus ciferrii TaxID=44093 RepID=A0A642V6J4_9ASCO|nr:hypothetical protein TRICI_002200 [Trichomonascus ciferrii]
MVEVSLTVGKLDASLALLLTEDHYLIEFPTILLPNDVEAGSIVKISCEKDVKSQQEDDKEFKKVQNDILTSFGVKKPKAPVLSVRNVTQTSIVLEWEPIDIATADIISLTLYKNGQRFGLIPTPLKRTATKLSGLAIDTAYSFHLVLATTAGTFESEKVTVKTHKMTDLSGITMCIGSLEGSETSEDELSKLAKAIGAKPLQSSVRLDTTHFICTVPDSDQYKRAQDWNIPVVRPEWVKACEAERRLVGVRAYYLNADPKLRPPIQRERTTSQATKPDSSIPQLRITEPEDQIPEQKEESDNDKTDQKDNPKPSVTEEKEEVVAKGDKSNGEASNIDQSKEESSVTEESKDDSTPTEESKPTTEESKPTTEETKDETTEETKEPEVTSKAEEPEQPAAVEQEPEVNPPVENTSTEAEEPAVVKQPETTTTRELTSEVPKEDVEEPPETPTESVASTEQPETPEQTPPTASKSKKKKNKKKKNKQQSQQDNSNSKEEMDDVEL